jgi:hypothetical protein
MPFLFMQVVRAVCDGYIVQMVACARRVQSEFGVARAGGFKWTYVDGEVREVGGWVTDFHQVVDTELTDFAEGGLEGSQWHCEVPTCARV